MKKPHFKYEDGYWKVYYKNWIFPGMTVTAAWANFRLWTKWEKIYK